MKAYGLVLFTLMGYSLCFAQTGFYGSKNSLEFAYSAAPTLNTKYEIKAAGSRFNFN